MNKKAYVAQLRAKLLGLGFTEEQPYGTLALLFRAPQGEGQRLLALAPFEANPLELVGEVHDLATEPVILVFPFAERVPDNVSDQVRSLWTERVAVWVADLEVGLVDRPSTGPRLSMAVIAALTEVERGAVEETWQRVTDPRLGARRPLLGGLGHMPFTRITLAVTVSYYLLVITASGLMDLQWVAAAIGGPPGRTLVNWGANHGLLVLEMGQHWRLFTYMLLHGGALHLGLNMWVLWNLGRHVEMIFGPLRAAFIYVVAGVAGGLASTMLRPEYAISVGASGSIFGLMGAMVYFAFGMRRQVDWREFLTPIGINLLFGFMMRGIDQYAHIGGLVGGLVAAFLAGTPGERGGWRTWATAVTAVLLLAVLAGVVPLPHLAGRY